MGRIYIFNKEKNFVPKKKKKKENFIYLINKKNGN